MIEQRAAVFEVWVSLLCSFAERGLSLDRSLNESSRNRLKSTLVAIVYALSDYVMDHSPAGAAVDGRGRDPTLRNLDDALAEWIAWLRPLGDESDEVTDLMAAWKPFVNAGDELAGLMKGLGI
ncbi:hypothetical protein GGTG_04660 [Gaeumannomyces tritici R3-111a-1]|uniref:Uncharacterized protein n=1 Tax=Gaeumannomyces tritici (strain R3-111a-1) TaxID=644352 RepID=J3NTR0_GAET3|nr:hypothetical protein GGTG_04660 [Gaeumannomyces tritici R3-111a-1]EJT79575.1 hypothetical protein GGTG_04660 [Gaeumannomyces tritici R3-111a-1]